MQIAHVPISEIDVDLQWNTRSPVNVVTAGTLEGISMVDDESAGMVGLRDNLLAVGQLTPVDVRPVTDGFYRDTAARYSLVTGFRRVTALRFIFADPALRSAAANEGRTIVPQLPDGCVRANVHEPLSERDAFRLNVSENGNREGVTVEDTFRMIERGLDLGYSVAELAVQLGKQRDIVHKYARLRKLPPDVLSHWTCRTDTIEGRPLVRHSRVTVRDMVEILRCHDSSDERRAAYVAAVAQRGAGEVTTLRPWMDRARDRAAATGRLLAKLTKAQGGVINVHSLDWQREIATVANVDKRLSWAEVESLAKAARDACARELSEAVAVPQTAMAAGADD